MLSFEELSNRVASYQAGNISFSDFANWFEDNCSDAYDNPKLRPVCLAVDAALSEYYYDHIGEHALKEELAEAIRPFALRAQSAAAGVAEVIPIFVHPVSQSSYTGTFAGRISVTNLPRPWPDLNGQDRYDEPESSAAVNSQLQFCAPPV